jgi:hypothetical protein
LRRRKRFKATLDRIRVNENCDENDPITGFRIFTASMFFARNLVPDCTSRVMKT